MVVVVVRNDTDFQNHLTSNGTKLIIVDFTASWCGPCLRVAPIFENLSNTYNRAVFLKVDVDESPNISAPLGVDSMPTFIFFRNQGIIDRMTGADGRALEAKIRQHYGPPGAGNDEPIPGAPGHMDLKQYIITNQSEALNESSAHPLSHCLQDDENYMESCCDNQLIISFAFSQSVKIHSIKFKAPGTSGPKLVKLFINTPNTIDFDEATGMVPTQSLETTPNDLTTGNPINLRFVKFQNVHNIQIFVQQNHDNSDVTRINYLQLIGSPITTTNMSDFKRVAGKKGELHY